MIRKILILTLLLVSLGAKSQILVYPDDRLFFTDLMLNINKDGAMIEGNVTFSEHAIFTVRENRIYRGWGVAATALLYTIEGGKVYRGEGANDGSPLYTIKDGKIYRGNSTEESQLLFTWRRTGVFKGSSTSPFDRVCFIQGRATQAEYFGVLMALGFLD